MLRERDLLSLLRASREPSPATLQQDVVTAIRSEAARRDRRRSKLPAGPLAAAWSAYRAGSVVVPGSAGAGTATRVQPLLGSWPPAPDLGPDLGLRTVGWGTRTLAGRETVAAEYRSARGARVVLFLWRGGLRAVAHGSRGGSDTGEVLAG